MYVVSRLLGSVIPVESRSLPGTTTPKSISPSYDFLLDCLTVMEAVYSFYGWVAAWWSLSMSLLVLSLSAVLLPLPPFLSPLLR